MKLNKEQLIEIISSKGLTCLNLDEYKNLDTILKFTCEKGHHIEASIKTVRSKLFKCPYCEGENSISEKIDNFNIPDKTGYRIIGIDNATENIGISVFDNGKLIYYHLYHVEGDTITRLLKNRKLLEQVFIEQWKPDFIALEDIQYQSNIQTFKILAMLLGSSLVSIKNKNIKCDTVYSKVWRAHFQIGGKTRLEQKKQAIEKIKTMYNISVSDDIAEAILIGKYAVDNLKEQNLKTLF